MEKTLAIYNYNPSVELVDIRLHPEIFPRIKDTPEDAAINRMVQLVFAAFLYRGQEAQPDKVRFIATALVQEINMDRRFGLPSLSWAEIGMVIRNAVLSKDLYGVSVATLYSALVDYCRGEGHEAAKKAFESKEPSRENPALMEFARRIMDKQ